MDGAVSVWQIPSNLSKDQLKKVMQEIKGNESEGRDPLIEDVVSQGGEARGPGMSERPPSPQRADNVEQDREDVFQEQDDGQVQKER